MAKKKTAKKAAKKAVKKTARKATKKAIRKGSFIRVKGARQHNLKGVDADIPLGKLTVVTGPSGSGKSSLAFHTLYAEGQRRYVETFSPYVRQFFDRMDKPAVDKIEGIPPAIAIEQRNNIRSTRSTVGTLTEINDYLKLLYPRIAVGRDPKTGEIVKPATPTSIVEWAMDSLDGERIIVTFPVKLPEEAKAAEIFPLLQAQGFLRVLIDGAAVRTDEPSDNVTFSGSVDVIQDRIAVSSSSVSRVYEAFENALKLGKNHCSAHWATSAKKDFIESHSFDGSWAPLQKPTAALFTFNNPLGACGTCRGFGRTIGIDLRKAVPDPSLSIRKGAIKPFQGERGEDCQRDLLEQCKTVDVDINAPWFQLTPKEQRWVLEGEGKRRSGQSSLEHSEQLWQDGKWYGVRGFFDWMETKSYKMHVRIFLSRYRSYTVCPDCEGQRLQAKALCFFVNEKSLPELWQMPVHDLADFIAETKASLKNLNADRSLKTILTELESRLDYLKEVGLGYLTLDRPANSLSGGEIARVNLTTCLGTSLTGTLFVLDEPTIGLHTRDIGRLTRIAHRLRDQGNTLVVVEHDEHFMKAADHIIDVGPGSGEEGGDIVYAGDVKGLLKSGTATSLALREPRTKNRESRPRKACGALKITGATCHNLQNVNFTLPLRQMVVLTGVSGSGKSTLAHAVLYRNLANKLGQPCQDEPAYVKSLKGWDTAKGVDRVEIIDQTPLARTPRSTPAVLLGAFTSIRELFVLASGNSKLTPGYFSFNSGKGRCSRCAGTGFEKVEMQFLSDLFLTCPDCDGKRYTEAALDYQYANKNVNEVLELTAREAVQFFESIASASDEKKEQTLLRKTLKALRPLVETGLGYLRLGQPLNTLSGGESQRLKLCQLLVENSAPSDKEKTTLLIMDEPTTGLHFSDVTRLLEIFQRLVDEGYSLLIIEHQLDVIRAADHLIEVGPDAGANGGEIVFCGTPDQIKKTKTATGMALADVSSSKHQAAKETALPDEGMISISGARHHNLKNIDLTIPREEMVVISGLSGSGKSTIAFDILFAEGQRRFLDSMSPYARQFAEQLERPDVDRISGLPPTVAIEQRLSQGGGKSTVATVTELYHFLRLLYAKLATQHCPVSGEPVISQSEEQIAKRLKALAKTHKSIYLLAPVIRGRKGFHTDVALAAGRQGYDQLYVDGEIREVEGFEPLARYNEHDIDFVVLELKARTSAKEIAEAIEVALRIGKGTMRALLPNGELVSFSTARVSAATGESFEEPDPSHFSFNSPRGWCRDCRGYGFISTVTAKRGRKAKRKEQEFNSAAEAEIHEELAKLTVEEEEMIDCPTCLGDRLKQSSRFLFINITDQFFSLPKLTSLTVDDAQATLSSVKFLEKREQLIARDILPELTQRLAFLQQVGLGYLSLNRAANTLSGGESQRIRLAAQLGSNLRGVLYILDEPTIGLHPRDNETLLSTLETLRNHGNSLLIVEHDEDTIERASHLIDLGPGAGQKGGRIVHEGPLKKANKIKDSGDSPTLRAIQQPIVHPVNGKRRKLPSLRSKDGWLRLKGCHANNLKHIDAQIPLGRLTVLTGVSGSGKSSLMRGCLKVAAGKEGAKKYKSATGFDQLKYCYEVDQSPIGKTTRSCPATYVKVFDLIRQAFAQLPEAKARGYTASRFSFNNKEGQCPECKGNGRLKLEMDFLPPSWVPCEACNELRYNPTTLQVLYNGASIGDVLQMSIAQASEFFDAHPRIKKPLKLLAETGLGYLTLGQPSPTLSGGEAQRLKLISELAKGRSKIAKTRAAVSNLYLIEEPTIGLHQQDIRLLIDVLHRLADEGHTVVVIEHHLALAAEADYHLDIGPEAGERGGQIVTAGIPEKTAQAKSSLTAPFLKKALSIKSTS